MQTAHPRLLDFGNANLQRKFFNFKYDTTQSVIENCAEVQKHAEELTALAEEIEESWLVSRILGLLPLKLHHFRSSWGSTSVADKNLKMLFERLKVKEVRLNDSKKTEDSDVKNALLLQQNPWNNQHQEKRTNIHRLIRIKIVLNMV